MINWWRAVRDCPEEFGRLVALTPCSRAEFAWACDAVSDLSLPPLRRALAFHLMLSNSLQRGTATTEGFRRRLDPKYFTGCLGEFDAYHIADLAGRIRRVQLECIDANDLLKSAASLDNAVIYCDPPYPTANNQPYAEFKIDYPRMAELLAAQSGAVAVSGYGDDWDLLGWERREFPSHYFPIKGGVQPRTEVLWRNARCVAEATAPRLL